MPSESNSEVLSSNARRSTRARRRAIGVEAAEHAAKAARRDAEDDDDDASKRAGVVLLGSVSVSVDALNAIGADVPKYEEPIECGQVRGVRARARRREANARDVEVVLDVCSIMRIAFAEE